MGQHQLQERKRETKKCSVEVWMGCSNCYVFCDVFREQSITPNSLYITLTEQCHRSQLLFLISRWKLNSVSSNAVCVIQWTDIGEKRLRDDFWKPFHKKISLKIMGISSLAFLT